MGHPVTALEARAGLSSVKHTVTVYDDMGRPLFTVDRWIWETALRRGDAQRWLGMAAP